MDKTIERIKRVYEKFKGNPQAMEVYLVKELEKELTFTTKPIKIPSGYKVTFHYDDEGHIKDMTFERIH